MLAFTEIKSNPSLNMTVVGFVNEDRDEWTRTWHGVPIYKPGDLEKLIADKKFDGLVLSNARLEGDQLQEMIKRCAQAGLPVRRFQIHWPEVGNGTAEPAKENGISAEQLSIEDALPATRGRQMNPPKTILWVKTILWEGHRFGFGRRTHRLGSTVRELKEFVVGLVGLTGLLAIAFSGCSSSNPPPTAPPPAALDPPAASAPFNPVEVGQDLKTSPLDQLWESRRSNATDFPIGVGEYVREISVPGMQEFQAQGSGVAAGGPEASGQQSGGNNTVRVDGLGDIDLPFGPPPRGRANRGTAERRTDSPPGQVYVRSPGRALRQELQQP